MQYAKYSNKGSDEWVKCASVHWFNVAVTPHALSVVRATEPHHTTFQLLCKWVLTIKKSHDILALINHHINPINEP